jgi:hypothetical protein
MTGPYFESWSHENLAKFAKEAYTRLQEQDLALQELRLPRQPLTEEEIELLALKHAPPIHPDFTEDDDFIEFARAIERAHGIGGGE